jgi:hypothetical protein
MSSIPCCLSLLSVDSASILAPYRYVEMEDVDIARKDVSSLDISSLLEKGRCVRRFSMCKISVIILAQCMVSVFSGVSPWTARLQSYHSSKM